MNYSKYVWHFVLLMGDLRLKYLDVRGNSSRKENNNGEE
jgi:hypothetical protein